VNHTFLLNLIAEKIKATSYLEIGVQNTANNFDKIKVQDKIGVDPNVQNSKILPLTSDAFFRLSSKHFKLGFIDGLHHDDQVKRDIINTWFALKPGGVMMIHDCNPDREEITHTPRDSKIWTGNVYKTICQIASPPKFTIDVDYGCCILRNNDDRLLFNDREVSWEDFDKNRKQLLNLVTVEEGLKIIDSWI